MKKNISCFVAFVLIAATLAAPREDGSGYFLIEYLPTAGLEDVVLEAESEAA